ncbi:integrin beta-like protein B [Schistocerca gregaria]|uniref:integrin beta-like protein B n=1 Tax=Schistocerca gregaria TaxID=7010 RepID=UPI00211EE5AD|nr:integrin beta-like protein B [Schistocerca gregaria]
MRSVDSVLCLVLLAALVLVSSVGHHGMASASSTGRGQFTVPKNALALYSGNALKCVNSSSTYFRSSGAGCDSNMDPRSPFPKPGQSPLNRVCSLQFQDIPGSDNVAGAAALLNDVGKIFTEGKTPTITNSNHDEDLSFDVLVDNTYFKVTYLNASCHNRNSLGYFKYNKTSKSIIFDDPKGRRHPGPIIFFSLSEGTDKCYPKGYSVEYGPFNRGETIGFYLVDNGYDLVGKQWANFTERSYYSINSLNKPGYKPIYVWVHLQEIGAFMIGFDDNGVNNVRDYDYNDIIVLMEVNMAMGNVSMQVPPSYGSGKLNVCSKVDHVPESTWLQQEKYTYALLDSPLQSDCVNYMRVPSPWTWAEYDESGRDAYYQGIVSTWRNYKGKSLVFRSKQNSSEQVLVAHNVRDGMVSEYVDRIDLFKGDPKNDQSAAKSVDGKDGKEAAPVECVWVGCNAVRVIRRPATILASSTTHSLCVSGRVNIYNGTYSDVPSLPSPDLTILEISGMEDKDVEVANLRLLRPGFQSRVLSLYMYYDLTGIPSQRARALFTESAASFLASNLDRGVGGFSDVRVSLYFYVPGLTPSYRFIGRADTFSDLRSKFRDATLALPTINVDTGSESSLLVPLSKILAERDSIASYKAVVVFAGKAWAESTEEEFALAARASGRSIGFVSPSSLSGSLDRLKSKVPHVWYDTDAWNGSNWYTALAGSVFESQNYVTRGYLTVPQMYSVYPEHDSLFEFDSSTAMNGSNSQIDLAPKYTVRWRANSQIVNDLTSSGDGVVRTKIGLSGWGVVSLNIAYNRPPIGRDTSIKYNSTSTTVELSVSDPDSANLLNIKVTSIPAVGNLSYVQDGVVRQITKAGTYINEFDEKGLPKYNVTNKLIYNTTSSGNYSFKYVVDDGCVTSREYEVKLNGALPNTAPIANHSTIHVSESNSELNPLAFNITGSIIDPDIHPPVYVWFYMLDSSKGVFRDSKNNTLKLRSEYGPNDPFVYYEDIMYFIPYRTFQPSPGVTYEVALYNFQETDGLRNESNNAFLYAQYTWSGETRPILRFQNDHIKIDPTSSRASFIMILEDVPDSRLDVYMDSMTLGNEILDGTNVLISYTSDSSKPSFDTSIMSVTVGSNAFTVVSGLVWSTKLAADQSDDLVITGTFRAVRVGKDGQPTGTLPNSTVATLTLTLSDQGSVGDKDKTPTAYNVVVPNFDKAQRSPEFDLAGTDLITPAPGTESFTFFVSGPPTCKNKDGQSLPCGALYRVDNKKPLSSTSAESADGNYASDTASLVDNTEQVMQGLDTEIYYGSKLSIYFEPSPIDLNYPTGTLTFTYTVFNGYNTSEPATVTLNIDDLVIPPESASRKVYMSQGSELTEAFPIQLSNGVDLAYLQVFVPSDEKDIYIGAAPTEPDSGTKGEGSVILTPSTVNGASVNVYFKMLSDAYSYLPSETPKVYKSFQFRACDNYSADGGSQGPVCSNNYTIDVYVVHTPHQPESSDLTQTVERSATLKLELPAIDQDEYDKGKLRPIIYIDSFALNGTLYSDEKLTQPISPLTANSVIELDSTVMYYVSHTLGEDVLRARDSFSYTLVDTTDLRSKEASVTIYVNPRGDPPSTTLNEITALQFRNLTFSLTDTQRYVTVEVSSSTAAATITSLPRGTLYECTDAACSSSNTVAITSVPHELSLSGLDSSLIYLSPPYEWGSAFTTIRYTLKDVDSGKTSSELTLTVNVEHVNNAPAFEQLSSSFGDGKLISLKQTDAHDFEWMLTDVDTLPSELYTVLVISLNQNQNWSLHRCLDRDCGSTEPLVSSGSNSSVNDQFSMLPTEVSSDDCKTIDDLYKLNGTLTEDTKCYAYFKYRLQPDKEVAYSTSIGFTFIGSDKLANTAEYGVAVRHSFVNRQPVIWAPPEIVSEAGTTNPFIRDNDPNSETYNKSVSITDIGASSKCLERFNITSDAPGEFVLSTSAQHMCNQSKVAADDSNPESPQLPFVTCLGSVDDLNSWLPELRFSTNQTTATLTFTIDDKGCSSGVDDDRSYSNTATTHLNLTATSGGSTGKVVGIVAGSAAAAGIVVLSALAYFLRHGMSSPPDVYFDIGSESVSTAPQNPLFQPSTQEYSSSIYRNA